MSQVEEVKGIVLGALGERNESGDTWAWNYETLLAKLAEHAIHDVTRGQLHALLTKMTIDGDVEPAGQGNWILKIPPLLAWEKPPQAEDPEVRAEYYGGGIPGAYAPNMSREWMLRWKAKMLGQKGNDLRVEIRKSVAGDYGHHAQVLIVAYEDGSVRTSMNGKAGWSEREWAELPRAVDEARKAMRTWRDGQLARSIQLPGPSRGTIEDMKEPARQENEA